MINFMQKVKNVRKENKIATKRSETGGNTHSKIIQKLLSIGVSASLMLAMVPISNQNWIAEAESPSIPKKLFATGDDLKDKNVFSLETEDDSKVGRINFGTRPNDVKYFSNDGADARTAKAGPMTWLIAGSDTDSTLVLYSEEPMMSAKNLDGNSDSRFQTSVNDQTYEGATVSAKHWGASNLRKQAQALVDKYFTESEQRYTAELSLTTKYFPGTAASTDLITDDTLYAPTGYLDDTFVKVGKNDSLTILTKFIKGTSWARTGKAENDFPNFVIAGPNSKIGAASADSTHIAAGFALNLSLSGIRFASAAGSTPTSSASQISSDTPMTLRAMDINYIAKSSDVTLSSDKVTYTAAEDERMVIIATGSDGNTYQYVAAGTGSQKTLTVDELGLPGDTEFAARAWIEKDVDKEPFPVATNSLSTMFDQNFTTKKVPSAAEFTFTAPSELIYDGNEKIANVTGQDGMGEITIKYYNSNGTQLDNAPKDAGTYTVKIDVDAGASYAAATDLTDTSWKFTIGKQTITPQITAEDKIYDGTENATVNVSFEGLQNNDELTEGEDYSVSAAFTNKKVEEGKTVTATITLNGTTKANNYTLSTNSATATAAINKKGITPQITAADKTYDGTDTATVTVTFDGLADGETLEKDTDYTVDTATFKDANAGEGKKVTVNFVSLMDSDKSKNYALNINSAETTANINKAKIKPNITAEDKIYDGKESATVSVSFEGLQKDEELVEGEDYSVSATFTNKEVGKGKNVTATIMLKDTAKANNYTLSTDSATATADINKKRITVTANDRSKNEGVTDPELTYTVDGLIEGDSLTGSLERVVGEAPGSYEIKQGTLTEENNLNYTITFVPGKFTINDSKVEQPSDRPEWGETMITIKGIKHYISKDGSRSVEISEKNTDANGIIWIKEESYDPYLGYDTAAWYGFDNSNGIFENGSRAYVHWYNKEQNPEKFSDIDETHEVEDNNCYYFEVGVIKPDGTSYAQLSEPIKFYVQIGDDWDREDLEAFYITQSEDEKVPVTFGTENYPEGEDEFGIMTLSHFSPYFIYDKLTDEEKAALENLNNKNGTESDGLNSQQEEKNSEDSPSDSTSKTGDEITYFAVSGLGLIMTLALGLMLNSKINKKKSSK